MDHAPGAVRRRRKKRRRTEPGCRRHGAPWSRRGGTRRHYGAGAGAPVPLGDARRAGGSGRGRLHPSARRVCRVERDADANRRGSLDPGAEDALGNARRRARTGAAPCGSSPRGRMLRRRATERADGWRRWTGGSSERSGCFPGACRPSTSPSSPYCELLAREGFVSRSSTRRRPCRRSRAGPW